MKHCILILLCLAAFTARAQEDTTAMSPAEALIAASANPDETLWDRANTAYINGAYDRAVMTYDSLLSEGKASVKLYYNMGNACFKAGQTGRAILYYSKAERLAPTDGDITYNLAVANSLVKDKIERVPQFFVERWIVALSLSLGGNTWTWLSLGLLALTLTGAVCYLLPGRIGRRKAGFWGGIACAALFVCATAFAASARSEALAPTEGVVMSTAVSVKSSPDRAAKDLFVLHEGTTVKVVGQLDEWREVVIADGNKGWMEASSIEMI